jgi:hypothetical protein
VNKIIIGLGALLAGASFATTGTGTGHAATAPDRFTLVADPSTNSLLARPCDACIVFSQPDGAHIGGTEYDSGSLRRHGELVGHFALVSIGVSPFNGQDDPGELQLTATLALPDGQIVGQSLEEPPLDGGVLAVTGGTGRYANARGTVRYTDNADGSTTLHVDLIG